MNPAYESVTFGIHSPEWKFLNTPQIGNRVDAKSGYFFIRDVTRTSPVLYREYCIQESNLVPRFSQGRARCKFHTLYEACSIANISRGVLGTRVSPDTGRIRVDGQIRFQCGYAWTRKFFNLERNSCGFKNFGCVWKRPKANIWELDVSPRSERENKSPKVKKTRGLSNGPLLQPFMVIKNTF